MVLIVVRLTADERAFLLQGLAVWGGPTAPTDAVARVVGYADVAEMDTGNDRLRDGLGRGDALTAEDWRRALVATELGFASDRLGAGIEWSIVTPFTDEQSVVLLRAVQRRISEAIHGTRDGDTRSGA
ncbi:hypothetical protein [Patulibacter minatonensis]|uniref:hypothetical protein n=1 Tax=Patulibacter minatonensis TaxID=298163 RepID=UPI00055B5ABA|nr:hypothetical protein [Patulibacter minatonensis]